MFTALTLTLLLGAPVPAASAPVAAGASPQVMEIKPDASGKLTITVNRPGAGNVVIPAANTPAPAIGTRINVASRPTTVELGSVKDLTITTADGKKVEKEDALKKLAAGGVVIVSSDGKAVSPVYLKAFKDDTLVLVSPELVQPAQGQVRPGGVKALPAIGGGPAPVLLPANPQGGNPGRNALPPAKPIEN